MRTDDARVRVLQGVVRQAELVGLVAAQVVQHGIRFRHESPERFLARGGFQVQRDAALVEVERLEEVTVVLTQEIRTHAARGIATLLAILDLDDIGAEIGQIHRAEGARAERLERQDADTLQRQVGRVHQIGFRSISWRAMIMRCISFVPSPMHISGASR